MVAFAFRSIGRRRPSHRASPTTKRSEVHGSAGHGTCCSSRRPREGAPMIGDARTTAVDPFDVVHERMASGQRVRVPGVIGDVAEQGLAAILETSISGRLVAREPATLGTGYGEPKHVVSDKGTKITPNPSCRGRCRTVSSGIPPRRAPCRPASARRSMAACGTSSSTRRWSVISTIPNRGPSSGRRRPRSPPALDPRRASCRGRSHRPAPRRTIRPRNPGRPRRSTVAHPAHRRQTHSRTLASAG